MYFFDIFYHPWLFLRKEWDNGKINTALYTDLEIMLELNNSNPVGCFFTPNWSYWKINNVWEKSNFQKKDWDKYYTFVATFDYKFVSEEIQKLINNEKAHTLYVWYDYIYKLISYTLLWSPQVVINDWNLLHLIYVFDKPLEDFNAYKHVQKYLLNCMDTLWFVYNLDINQFIRIPETINRPQNKEVTSVYLADKTTIVPAADYDFKSIKIEKTSLSLFESYSVYCQNSIKGIDTWLKELKNNISKYRDVLSIPIPNLLEKINSVDPHDYSIANWYVYKGNNANQNRIYSEKNNSIFCLWRKELFSWWPWEIICHFFKWPQASLEFLSKHYSLDDWNIQDQNLILESDDVFKFMDQKVVFRDWCVRFFYTEVVNNREINTVKTVVNNGLTYIWFGQVAKTIGNGATLDNSEYVLLFKKEDNVITMQPFSSEKDFNRKMNKYNLFRDWSDLMVRWFFKVLMNAPNARKLRVIQESWYYEWFTVLGDYIYPKQPDCINLLKERLYNKTLTNVSVKDFAKKFNQLWPNNITSIILLQMIALSWMNKWHNVPIFPALMITGDSDTGKTTTRNILLSFVWYTHARIKSANGMTPQPLQYAWCDPSILTLEEFTKITKVDIENIMRNIINRDESQKGTLNWNVTYEYKSPIFALGENTPMSESLINRFVHVRFKPEWKLSDKVQASSLISELSSWTAYNEINEFYLDTSVDDIMKGYYSARKVLQKHLSSDREIDVYSYVYYLNTVFKLVSNEELIECILVISKKTSFGKRKPTWLARLRQIIINAVSTRSAKLMILWDAEKNHSVSINMNESFYNSFYGEMIDCAWQANLTQYFDFFSGVINITIDNEVQELLNLSQFLMDTFNSELSHSNLNVKELYG